MAARVVAWAGRMFRRGGSPGAVSSFISVGLLIVAVVTPCSAQSLSDRRAREHTRKSIARARTISTRIVVLK